ncbi:MAG TPA: M23 family metallopeptidase [Kofleriaceae bacterium]|nr:M23 family metallopeptidase [Kofleriaceae bacterium]
MRAWLLIGVLGCVTGCPPPPSSGPRDVDAPVGDLTAPHVSGQLDDRMVDFQFEGGELVFEMYRGGTRIEQLVRNRYTVPVVIHWTITALDNVDAMTPLDGTAVLPAAPAPLGNGAVVVLAELQQVDPGLRYRRQLYFSARFGDPRARPQPYVYGLPYPHGLTFSVLQGFHGEFSHRGSNEYAVDFNCPVATPVVATRPGMVVAINASAQGSGTTPEFLDDKRANFVIVRHDDGTLGEYMHLSPSGVMVHPGQRVRRGQEIALSGNTGFSTTPHLHFQVMTASDDGMTKRSFPFELAIRPRKTSPPVQGQRYSAWE